MKDEPSRRLLDFSHFNKSRKLFIFLLIILPFLIIGLFSFINIKNNLDSGLYERRQAIAYLSATVLREKLDRYSDLAVSFATQPQFRKLVSAERWEEATAILKDVPTNFPGIYRIYATDLKGIVKLDPLNTFNGKDFSSFDWYKGITVVNWKPYFSAIHSSLDKASCNIVSLAVPFKNEAKSPVGFLVLEIKINTLLQWCKDIDVGDQGYVYFVDKKAQLVTICNDTTKQEPILYYSSVPVVQKPLRGERGIEISYNPVVKQKRLVAYQSVADYGWGAIVQQPVASAFEERNTILLRILFIYGFIFLFNSLLAVLLIKVLTKQKDAEEKLRAESAHVQLLKAVAVASNEADSVEQAMQIALTEICKLTRWEIGHLYLVDKDGERLLPADVWSAGDLARFSAIIDISNRTTFLKGVGLPGRVLESKKPIWINDINLDKNFPRKRMADINIKAASAFPVLVKNEVTAVLEFFSIEVIQPDEKLLEVMANIGSQLGRVVERKRSEDEIRSSEGHIKALFNSAPDAVVVIDEASRIIEWNPQAEKIFGWTKEECIGTLLPDKIIPIQYREAHLRGMRHYLKTGQGPVMNKTIEVTALHKNNTEFYIDLSISSVTRNDGRKLFIAFIADVSSRKSTEAELFNKTVELELSKKLEEKKDEFIGIASHELKTPLTSIKAYMQLLERNEQIQKDGNAIQYVSKTNNYIAKLEHLISDLLDVSKIQAGKMQFNMTSFHMGEFIKESIENIQHISPKHKIVQEGNVDIFINGDKQRLEQVFNNFLSNAIKYSPDADKVIVRVSKENDVIKVAIRDFGIGIPAGKQGRIFDRFYRVEDPTHKFSGLGIGLYISSQIVKRHGGKVWVDSEVGNGSTFYFTLPVSH